MERIKFYSSNDMLYGYGIDRISTMMIPEFSDIDVNDALEFYNIKKYFDDGINLKDWALEDQVRYVEKSKILYSLTARFFNSITDDSLYEEYMKVDINYRSDFWELFDIFKLYKNISETAFNSIVISGKVYPHDLFKYKNIVQKYGQSLRWYLLDTAPGIDILLYIYEQDFTDGDKLFLPTEFTSEDCVALVLNYINGEHPHPNTLENIISMQYSPKYPITDEIRLDAKHRFAEEMKKIAEDGIKINQSLCVEISSEQEEYVSAAEELNGTWKLTYSQKWLENTLDFPSILNNFIYVFEFADVHMRCLHVSKKNNVGVLEKLFESKSSRKYYAGIAFRVSNNLASLQLNLYYSFLENNNIYLEDVLNWFYTDYLQKEFNCPEIRVSFPNKDIAYAEKCNSMIIALETIIKQFTLYVKHRKVDFELLSIFSTPMKFCDIPSMIENKYLYGCGKDFSNITTMLFSDQSMLSYVERIGEKYDCLFELIRRENIYLSDYRESYRECFDYLEEKDIIKIDESGLISFGNVYKVILLLDLYRNDVISIKHFSHEYQKAAQELESENIVYFHSSLFSQPEINYYNYLLNRAEYCNGLDLRNRYIHGIQQVTASEKEHKQNYYLFLRLFIILTIKINEEFCLLDEKNNHTTIVHNNI